jgi:hypothetical protein
MRISDLHNFVSLFKSFAQAIAITMSENSKSTGKAKDVFGIDPGAWGRFARLLMVVIKSGPKRKAAKNPKPSLRKLAMPLRSDLPKNGRVAENR